MFKKICFQLLFIAVIACVPAFAAKVGCQKYNFLGSFTRVDAPSDVFGDGTVIHQYIYQLTLHSDGSARQAWTGAPDYQNTFGTGTDLIGSWTCRDDGKLVINAIYSNYFPTTPSPNAPNPDIALVRSYRTTALYDVTSDNTLVRIQSRSRSYLPSEDPTNATGGTLLPISNTSITYNRFIATDADLLLP